MHCLCLMNRLYKYIIPFTVPVWNFTCNISALDLIQLFGVIGIAGQGCMMRKLGNFIIILLLTTLGDAWINRTKLCVEFRVRNSRWIHDLLDVSENTSESGCLWQCVRHSDCWAYNLWRNGTCELVRGMGDCSEANVQERCTYVHLGECTGRVPWDVGRRNWSADVPCLTWQRHEAGRVCPSDMLKSPSSSNCVAVIPHKGLYLPGRYANSKKFKTTLEAVQPMWTCSNHGYTLRVAAGCPTTWQSYNVGDDLPGGAVRVSFWTDGSPVYLVSNNGEPGYYLVSKQQAFVLKDGQVHTPTSMLMLVYVWRHVFSTDLNIFRKANTFKSSQSQKYVYFSKYNTCINHHKHRE